MKSNYFINVDLCPLCKSDQNFFVRRFSLSQHYSCVDVAECERCGLVFKRRIASDFLKKRIYDNSYVHFVSAQNDDNSSFERIYRMGHKHNKRHLDYGCGGGGLVRQAVKLGWDSYGVDVYLPDSAKVGVCGDRFIKTEDATEIIRRFGKFDVITMWAVIEHLENPLESFKVMSECLKPGGRILFNAPNADSVIARRNGGNWGIALLIEHLTFWTQNSIRFLCAELNMDLKLVRSCGTPFPLGSTVPSAKSIGIPDPGCEMDAKHCVSTVAESPFAEKKVMIGSAVKFARKLAANPLAGRCLRKLLEVSRVGDHVYVVFQKGVDK